MPNSTKNEILGKYPDVLTLKDLCEVLGVRSTKTASKWLRERENEIGYFRIGRDYRIPKMQIVKYFSDLSRVSTSKFGLK